MLRRHLGAKPLEGPIRALDNGERVWVPVQPWLEYQVAQSARTPRQLDAQNPPRLFGGEAG